MSFPRDLASCSREDLLAVVVELHRQTAEVTATVKAVRAEPMPRVS
jgi:hypothetical protein